MRWTDLTPPEWRDRDAQALAELERTGTVKPFEKEYFRKDGSRVPVLVGAAIFEEGGNEGVAFVLDLTERKRAEAEARESERRYREVQTELAHANRVATMGQLTASIAHEVNQPIAATVTSAHAGLRWLAAQPPDLEEVTANLARIVRDGNRAGDVIGRIRALIKKAPPRQDRLEINGAIREVIELTHGEALKNGVSVQTQLADGLPFIEGDRVQLQQVILNLIINAIEAMSSMSEGARDLLISTGTAGSDGVLVTVRDSGPGLSPATLSASSTPSTRPSRAVWGWGCRSAVRSSRRMAEDCGRARTYPAARSFNSRCPPSRAAHRDRSAETVTWRPAHGGGDHGFCQVSRHFLRRFRTCMFCSSGLHDVERSAGPECVLPATEDMILNSESVLPGSSPFDAKASSKRNRGLSNLTPPLLPPRLWRRLMARVSRRIVAALLALLVTSGGSAGARAGDDPAVDIHSALQQWRVRFQRAAAGAYLRPIRTRLALRFSRPNRAELPIALRPAASCARRSRDILPVTVSTSRRSSCRDPSQSCG